MWTDPIPEAEGSNATNTSAHVTFEVSPSNSGDVYCNGEKVSSMNKVYSIGTELSCNAISKNSFIFNSWAGLSFNASNPIILKILHNGTLTANFSEAPLIYIGRVLSHPFVLLVIGAAITSYVIPLLTRRWQDHQKELELKVDLVSQISESVHRIIMAIEPLEFGSSYKEVLSNYSKAYLEWQLKIAVIKAQIKLYFPKSEFNNKLADFFTIVENIYLLARNTNQTERINSFNIIKSNNMIKEAKTAVTIQARDNINWDILADKYSSPGVIRPDYITNWLNLKTMILSLQSELLDDIMKLSIPGFSNVNWIKPWNLIRNALRKNTHESIKIVIFISLTMYFPAISYIYVYI